MVAIAEQMRGARHSFSSRNRAICALVGSSAFVALAGGILTFTYPASDAVKTIAVIVAVAVLVILSVAAVRGGMAARREAKLREAFRAELRRTDELTGRALDLHRKLAVQEAEAESSSRRLQRARG